MNPDSTYRDRAGYAQFNMILGPWAQQAICATTDPDLFFPERGATSLPAKAICRQCPVRLPCLTEGLNENEGVWGGLNPDDRAKLRQLITLNPRQRTQLLRHAATVNHESSTTHYRRDRAL